MRFFKIRKEYLKQSLRLANPHPPPKPPPCTGGKPMELNQCTFKRRLTLSFYIPTAQTCSQSSAPSQCGPGGRDLFPTSPSSSRCGYQPFGKLSPCPKFL